ncbi:sensor domain-containing protein [Halalkalibacter wakoensis]|nr:EAL domain-containing protein [Halalkalibacter wakoensis]
MDQTQIELNNYLEKKDYPYKELLENFTEAIYVISLQGKFIDYNQGFTSLAGPWEEYVNTNFLDLVHPDDIDLAKSGFVETLEGKVLKEETLRIFAKDGNEKTIVTSKVPLLGEDGQLLGILGIAKDITVEIQLQTQIKQQYYQYKSLLKNSSSVNCIMSEKGELIYRSPSLESVLGYKPGDLQGSFFQIVHPDDLEEVTARFNDLLSNPEEPLTLDIRILHKNGHWRTIHSISNNRIQDPDIKGIIVNYHDVTEMRNAQQKIKHMAYHDYLTDLPNRRYFEELAENELKVAKQNSQKLALLFIDIDRFKFINDTLGHNIGDKVLKELAKVFKEFVSEKEIVARIAGDEFMILIPNLPATQAAEDVATKILKRFEAPFFVDQYELFITGSIGMSVYPDSGEELVVLMKHADLALYWAKENKGPQYKVFTPEMEQISFKNYSVQNDLRKAIQNDELELYYQPKVNSITRQIVGAEALIRWNHPKRGTLSPAEFIPLAEESGLIIPLGEWVFQNVCKQLKAWENRGISPIIVSLNFSAIQMLQKGLVETIAAILEEHQLDGKWIEIEMTESLILDHSCEIKNRLEALRQLGIHLAIDDFGTGYSSLSYLRKFTFNTIKLDKSFINDIHTSPDNKAIIEFIIQLSKQLKMKVVAEGVEEEEQLAILQNLNCDELQGYLFSKPQPLEQFERLWLRDAAF